MAKVAPSILAANFDNLEEEIKKVIEAGADSIHIDVMDGEFVQNRTNGIEMLKRACNVSGVPLDVHLMVKNPKDYINSFEKANIITFHIETVNEETAKEIIQILKSKKIKIGISIKPNTPIERIIPYIDQIDVVLVMTVEPGKGGQKLIPQTIQKIKSIREISKTIDIEVDGGINEETMKEVKEAGANILVAGTSIFKTEDKKTVITKMKE